MIREIYRGRTQRKFEIEILETTRIAKNIPNYSDFVVD